MGGFLGFKIVKGIVSCIKINKIHMFDAKPVKQTNKQAFSTRCKKSCSATSHGYFSDFVYFFSNTEQEQQQLNQRVDPIPPLSHPN